MISGLATDLICLAAGTVLFCAGWVAHAVVAEQRRRPERDVDRLAERSRNRW